MSKSKIVEVSRKAKKPPGLDKLKKLLKQVVAAPPLRRSKVKRTKKEAH
jgi:hypothetical protein